jgi:hypothetical protein
MNIYKPIRTLKDNTKVLANARIIRGITALVCPNATGSSRYGLKDVDITAIYRYEGY